MANVTTTVPGAIPGFLFKINVNGFDIGQASKITGFEVQTPVINYRGGADSNTFRKQRGITEYVDIVIEKIYTNNFDTWALLGLVFEPVVGILGNASPIYKTDIIITLLDLNGKDRVKFFIKNAWVRSYKINDLDANKSDYAIESITLAHEGITKFGVEIV